MSLSQVGEHRLAEYKEDGSATQRGPRVAPSILKIDILEIK